MSIFVTVWLLFLLGSTSASSFVASAWYAGWLESDFSLANVSWSKYTQLTYAFAVPASDGGITLQDSDMTLLPQFVEQAHNHGVIASLSIGGWGGSRYFSQSLGTSTGRTKFVNAVVELVSTYSLDGIDFDWEFPNRQGIGCNTINANDSLNFLAMMQELRQQPEAANLTLSVATSLKPFNDSSSVPMTNVSAFAEVLDYIAIMNYDVWTPGFDPTVGPNAPLNDSCAPPEGRNGSATSAVEAWTSAGMPRDQIVLGVPAYGHSFHVDKSLAFQTGSTTVLASYAPSNLSLLAKGDSWDSEGTDICGVEQGYSGIYNFWGLIEDGFLNVDGTMSSGIAYTYDNCSQTPYVYKSESEVMVSFDNQQSFAAKGDFIRKNGLKGFAMWQAAGDYQDLLLDSILSTTSGNTPSSSSPSATSGTSQSSSIRPSAYSQSFLLFLLWLILSPVHQ